MKPTIKEVALEKFDLSLAEMRIINPHWVAKIQSSMWVHGQLQPVVVRPYKDKYQIIDGIKRVYAATELMLKTLECYVLDVDLKQAKLLVLSYNRLHQSMEVWEEAMVLTDLVKRHGLNQQSPPSEWICNPLRMNTLTILVEIKTFNLKDFPADL